MILKLIFFKNVPYEDLFIIFLAFRGHRRTHGAMSRRCLPSEILILCPNEPCLANLASGKKIGKKAFFDIFLTFFELQRDKGNSSGSTKSHLEYLHMILLRDKNDIAKKKFNRKSFQAALLRNRHQNLPLSKPCLPSPPSCVDINHLQLHQLSLVVIHLSPSLHSPPS